MKKILTAALALCFAMGMWAQAPFCISDSLLNLKDTDSLGLSKAPGQETVVVFAPTASTDHFSHGIVLCAFKDALYCMWQSSAASEDTDDTWVAYSRSTDDGQTWSAPAKLDSRTSGYCSSGGWWVNGDTLVAYINVWAQKSTAKETDYITSVDGLNWSEPQPVRMADGSILEGIFEQDPHQLADGRIICAAHMLPGLYLTPLYTDDPSGVRGWQKGVFPYETNGSQSREMEPSFYVKPGTDTIVMVARDNKKINGSVSYKKMASVSTDRGEHWTAAYLTEVPDSKAKQSAGNLPDGTAFIASNPSGYAGRVPMALLLSADGTLFNTAYALRTMSDKPEKKFNGNNSWGYSYPKSMIHGDWLYVGYAVNKEDVAYTRVPLSAISLRSATALSPVAADIQLALSGRRLQLSLTEPATVSIYSTSGQRLNTFQAQGESATDLSALPQGVYLIRVSHSKGQTTQKIILK